MARLKQWCNRPAVGTRLELRTELHDAQEQHIASIAKEPHTAYDQLHKLAKHTKCQARPAQSRGLERSTSKCWIEILSVMYQVQTELLKR